MSQSNKSLPTVVYLCLLLGAVPTTISLQECPRTETNSNCSCTNYLLGLQVECQNNDTQISIIVGHNEKMVINCHHTNMDTFDYTSLPKMNSCNLSIKHIYNCPFSLGQPEGSIFQKFCLATAKMLIIESSGPFRREHFEGFHNLESLTLTSNDLRTLPDDVFNGLPRLRSLHLVSNKFKLQANIFASLQDLDALNLRNNSLHDLPPNVFQHQKQLQDLDVSNNHLTNLAKASFSGCFSLKRLQLRSNKLVTLPPDVFAHLSNLERVDFSENYFQALPERLFTANRHLKAFELTDNHVPLREAPAKLFANLPILREVRLCCGLETIPEDFFANSTFIGLIDMSKNHLTALPPRLFADQYHLTDLNLSRNRLKFLPDGLLSKNRNLENLVLSYNRLVSISNGTFSSQSSLKEIHIDNNNLSTIHGEALLYTQQLTHVHLDNNQLQFIAIGSFINFKSLRMLNLSKNSIEVVKLDAPSRNLSETDASKLARYPSFLDFSQNKIHRLQDAVLSTLNHSRSIMALAGNPWMCDCTAQGLVNFVQLKHKLIHDVDQMECADGRKVFQLAVSILCSSSKNTVVISGCVFIATVGLCAAIYYKFRQQLKVWLYARGMCLWFVSEEDLDRDKKYDAFVSYSHKDEDFVTESLLPQLESGPRPFKICIHVRDWVIGEFIPNQIVQSVADSRRTIIILSTNFLESVWGRMEFRAAHTAALTEGRARVIVVIYGDIGNIESLDPELRAYLKMNTYVKWNDRWFWKKLRYAMPHSSRIPISDDVELKHVKSSLSISSISP